MTPWGVLNTQRVFQISNACGTIALLHALLNVSGPPCLGQIANYLSQTEVTIKPGSLLEKYQDAVIGTPSALNS